MIGGLLKIFILVCGLVFVSTVVYLLIRRKINERNSLLWLAGSFIIFAFSAFPDTLDTLAGILGIKYPPTLLFLLSTFVLLFVVLNQSIQISILNERLKELTQRIAIEHFKEKEPLDLSSLENITNSIKEEQNLGTYENSRH